MKRLLAAASVALMCATSYGLAMSFSMNDIRYWVGEGTNRCAVVIDFNDSSIENSSFAWGYRWNGDAPSMTAILQQITAADKRLKMFASSGQWGTFIEAFGYDADGDGGTFTLNGYVKSDDDDIFPAITTEYDTDEGTGNTVVSGNSWMQLYGTGLDFTDVTFDATPYGVDSTYPEDGQWICWRVCQYVSLYDADGNFLDYSDDISSECQPVAADYAFGMDNIRYWVGEGTNSCAVVIDFNDGSVENSSFAWGYRWNGEAPSMTAILQQITAADNRLKLFASSGQWGTFVEAFGYDADGDGGTFTLNGYVKSDGDDIFPAITTEYDTDEGTGNTVVSGNSWMQLYGTGPTFSDVSFTATPYGVDSTYPEDGQWICWRVCQYVSLYDADGNFLDYSDDINSEYMPVAAYPSAARAAALPKVGYSSYANLEAAFDAARGGGSVTLPEMASVNTETKTVTVGTAETETLQTYVVPAYFDMAVSGSSVRLSLNAAATPTLAPIPGGESAQKPFEVSDSKVTIVPSNVIDGLYYGIATSPNLNSEFAAPTEWVRAVNGTVVLEKAKSVGVIGEFYRVRVSDVDEAAR